MGALSIWHIAILGVIALVLFGGRGKISDLMGDFGKGVSSFKKGLNTHDEQDAHALSAKVDSAATFSSGQREPTRASAPPSNLA